MKKKLLAIIPVASLLASLAVSLNDNSVKNVKAAYDSRIAFTDSFDEDEINQNWEVEGQTYFEQHYPSMRLHPSSYDWEAVLSLNREFTGDYKVIMELATHYTGGWFAIAFGSNNPGSNFVKQTGGFVFYDLELSQVLDTIEGTLKPRSELYNLSAFGNEIDKKRTVEITVHKVDEDHSSIQCEVFENDTSLGKILESPMTLNASLDGYIGFNSLTKNVEIYNFEVVDGHGTRLYYDDFSTSSVMYPSSGTELAEWHTNKFLESELKVGYVSSLYLKNVDSGLTYINPLSEISNKNINIAYKLEAEIQYSPMDLDVETGFEILKPNFVTPGYFFGLRKAGQGYYLVAYNGNVEQSLVCQTEDLNMTTKMILTIYQNKTINFKCGDLELNINVDTYEGYVGLYTRNRLGNRPLGSGGYINKFTLTKENYYKRDNGDLYNNFNGVKETYFEATGEYAYDYYISKSEWNVGMNVAPSKWIPDVNNGKLEFSSATSSSFFGPKKVFRDFVIKFDVEINSNPVPDGGRIGLQVGNSRPGLYYENTKSIGIGHFYSQGEYITVPTLTNMEYAPGAPETFGEHVNLFENNGKLTLMYVVRDNTVTMYFVSEGEDESNFSRVRTTAMTRPSDSTDGYLAIYGIGLSFAIDNLSIINLDIDTPACEYNGESDYQEVTRLDFTDNESINGLEVNDATYSNKKYRINNDGEIRTSKLVNDFLFRSKIKDIENTLLVNQDTLNVKFINRHNNKAVEVNDGTSTQTHDLGNNFDFRNSLLEVEKIGTLLNVRIIGGDKPQSLFEGSVFSFNITATNPSKLILKSINGFVDISSFTFINFNRYATIAPRDYNEETDNFDPWTPRPPIDGNSSKKGCAGTASMSSLFISAFALVAIIGVVVIRRRKQ